MVQIITARVCQFHSWVRRGQGVVGQSYRKIEDFRAGRSHCRALIHRGGSFLF